MSNNTCYSNTYGIRLYDSSNNTMSNNTCYSNTLYGILLYESSNNTLSNNSSYSNDYDAIHLYSSSNNTMSNNTCYSNSRYGIYTGDSNNNTVINCKLGPNNTTGDIGYESDKVSKLVLKDCELKSLIKVDTGEIDTSGSYLISYNQNNSTGAVKIWGDYRISDTQKFNYSDLLYVSTATQPTWTKKGNSTISYPTTTYKTETRFWKIECTDAGIPRFSVKWSTSDVYNDGAPANYDATGGYYTETDQEVSFKITDDGTELGDAFYFVTISSSADQNIQKKIEFGKCSIPSIGNRSKLTVQEGGKIELVGESGYETEISTCEAGYYIFEITGTISSDAYIKAEHFKFNYSTGVTLGQYITIEKFNNGKFHNTGNNYHVKTKAVDLINSSTYFYGLSFDDTGEYDFTVQDGSSIEVRLPFVRGNYDDKVEAGSFIHWNTPPTNITNLTALLGDNSGEVNLSWTAPREDTTQGNLVNIINGEYGIKYSTYTEYDFDGAENFDVQWETSTVYGESQTKVVTGLIYETTYYFRIWAKDRTDLWSEISSGATSWCNISPAAITTLTALAEDDGEVTLSWTAPGDDVLTGDITDGKFRIRWSTYNVSDWESDWDGGNWNNYKNKYSIDIDTSCAPFSNQSRVVTGLTGGSTYYFRIWTADELLNWSELSNGATTTVKIIYGVDITTVNINFTYYEAGGSTIIPSAVPVKSISNVVSNFAVLAATGTSGTPWQISDTPGLDKITIYCVINSTMPSITNFKDDDKLTNDYQTCTNTKFSIGNKYGVNVEAGGIRNTWYLIKFPLASNTTVQQSLIINFKAQKP